MEKKIRSKHTLPNRKERKSSKLRAVSFRKGITFYIWSWCGGFSWSFIRDDKEQKANISPTVSRFCFVFLTGFDGFLLYDIWEGHLPQIACKSPSTNE